MRRGSKAALLVARGFSLVEVIVAVAILALVCAVMIPSLGNMGRVELRRSGRQLAGNIRRAFDESALTGQTFRMVLQLPPLPGARSAADFDKTEPPPAIAIEAAEGAMLFSGRDGALQLADDASDAVDTSLSSFDNYFEGSGVDTLAPPAAAGAQSASQETMRAMLGINTLAQKANRPTFKLQGTVELPRGVYVRDVWIDGMHEPEEHGSATLIFFPAGYTQHAVVHLADTDNNAVSIEVEAITGKSTVTDGYLDIHDLDGR